MKGKREIMKRKLNITISILFTIILFVNSITVYASEVNPKLKIIKKSSEQKYLDNNRGTISKEIVEIDENNGNVTIELKLNNTTGETSTSSGAEIFLVIDNSGSMAYQFSDGRTRKEVIAENSKKLVNSLLQSDKDIKIGIVRFWGADLFDFSFDNAELMLEPTSDIDTILSTIDNIPEVEEGTNIEAGINKAIENFKDGNHNKIIILLTDGVPTCDAHANRVWESTVPGSTQKVIDNTKNTIKSLEGLGINFISMMTGLESEDEEDYEEHLQMVDEIFGTEENPTYGKFYNIEDNQIEDIISNEIFNDVSNIIQQPINNIKIVDKFPTEILENFEFEIVEMPNYGTVESEINIEDKTITWNIDKLNNKEIAIFRYKLKVKNINDEKLLEKEMATNENVELTYLDYNGGNHTIILDSSPIIKISKQEQNDNNQQEDEVSQIIGTNEDPTIAKDKLPQTGIKIGALILLNNVCSFYRNILL